MSKVAACLCMFLMCIIVTTGVYSQSPSPAVEKTTKAETDDSGANLDILKNEMKISESNLNMLKELKEKVQKEIKNDRNSLRSQIKKALTSDQQAKWEKAKESVCPLDKGENFQNALNTCMKDLSLTVKQQDEIKKLMTETKTKIQERRKVFQDKLKETLTPEQYQKYQELLSKKGKVKERIEKKKSEHEIEGK